PHFYGGAIMKVNIVIISLLILSLSSCALFKSPASRHELKPGETYWFDYDSTRSSAIYIPADSNIKYCVAPPPDVAQSVIAALKAEMSTEQIQKVSGDAEFSTAVVDLARRTTTVNFIRDTLYRVCEARLQGPLTATEKEIFLAAIAAAKDMAIAEKDKQKQELAQTAERNGASVETIQKILEQ
ncbi:TPA: hypothetical protein ACX37Z_003734, partial [Serratia marcescens]